MGRVLEAYARAEARAAFDDMIDSSLDAGGGWLHRWTKSPKNPVLNGSSVHDPKHCFPGSEPRDRHVARAHVGLVGRLERAARRALVARQQEPAAKLRDCS